MYSNALRSQNALLRLRITPFQVSGVKQCHFSRGGQVCWYEADQRWQNEAGNRLNDMRPLQIRLAQTKEGQETPRLLSRPHLNCIETCVNHEAT